MKKLSWPIVALLGLVVLGCAVWPTPWDYGDSFGAVRSPEEWNRRVHRISGDQQVFVNGMWREVMFNRTDVIP